MDFCLLPKLYLYIFLGLHNIAKDLQKLQDKVDNYQKHDIMFSVYTLPTSSQEIKTRNFVYFNQTIYKSKDTVLDLSTGTFTASVNGIYEFSYSGGVICTSGNRATNIAVKQKGYNKLTFEHYGSSNGGYGLMTFNFMLKLQHMDTVQLYITEGKVYSNKNEARVFNGKLIQAI